jgi:enamine deaminase RidA (YjgF/YER057c/UK114 family)
MGNQIFPLGHQRSRPQRTGRSDDPKKQIAQVFINMTNIIAAAGGTTDSIAKVIVYLKDIKHERSSIKSGPQCFPTKTIAPRVIP